MDWDFLRNMCRKVGFGQRWMQWLEAGVFNSCMSVLVNGSLTEEFSVRRGLRQGDPLSPYLFTIVAEGLEGLVWQAIDVGMFKQFKVNGRFSFSAQK